MEKNFFLKKIHDIYWMTFVYCCVVHDGKGSLISTGFCLHLQTFFSFLTLLILYLKYSNLDLHMLLQILSTI